MNITADILNDNCSYLGWTTDFGGGTITVDNGFKLLAPNSADTCIMTMQRTDLPFMPAIFTLEVKTYFPVLDIFTDPAFEDAYVQLALAGYGGIFQVGFASSGLWLHDGVAVLPTLVFPNVVKCNETAADQTWRFEVNCTVPSASVATVCLDGVLLGNFSFTTIQGTNYVFFQSTSRTPNSEVHLKELKLGSGNGSFDVITADILDDDCTVITSGWGIIGTSGYATVSDGFKLAINDDESTNKAVGIQKVITASSDTLTLEIKTLFTALGDWSDEPMNLEGYSFFAIWIGTWALQVFFTSTGIFLIDSDDQRVNVTGGIVKCNETAADQILRFEIDKTVEASSTVSVYLDYVSLGTYNAGAPSGMPPGSGGIMFIITERKPQIAEVHLKEVKIGTGLGPFDGGGSVGDPSEYGVAGGGGSTGGGSNVAEIVYIAPKAIVEPVAVLSWSANKGKTWSNEYLCSLGKPGRFSTKAVWRALGWSYNRVWKLTVDSPIKKVVLGAYAEVSK